MDLDDWLRDLQDRLTQVESGVGDCAQLTNGLAAAALVARTKAADMADATGQASDRRGRSYLCIALAQESQVDLVSLFHDIELVADWNWLLTRAGVDPDQLFTPVSGEYGGGVGYRFEQTGPLDIRSSPGAATDVAPPSQAAFGIPVELQLVNNTTQGRLAFSVDLATLPGRPAVVTVNVGHPPRLSSTQPLPQAARTIVEDRAADEIRQGLGVTQLTTPTLDMLPRQPSFWCAWHDDIVRIGGRVLPRKARRRAFIASIPAGFPLAVRFDFEILADRVRQEVRRQGASLFSGPTVTGEKTFEFVAGGSHRWTLKIGCDVASASARVAQRFKGRISVVRNVLVSLVVDPVGGPDVDVSISPRIPPLTGWVEDFVEGLVRDKLPAIERITDEFVIGGARRADLWLSADHVTIGLEPQ